MCAVIPVAGQAVVRELIASERCGGVTALVRSGRGRGPLPEGFFGASPKLTVREVDYDALPDDVAAGADAVFSCLGFSGGPGSAKVDNPAAFDAMKDPMSGYDDPVARAWQPLPMRNRSRVTDGLTPISWRMKRKN